LQVLYQDSIISSVNSVEISRLLLRPHRLTDLHILHEMDTDADARRFNGGVADRATTLHYLERAIATFGTDNWKFAIDLTASDAMVGWCWLKYYAPLGVYEIGYQIARPYWRQGIATEASTLLIAFAFDAVGLDAVSAIIDPTNTPSLRVAEKLGMTFIEEREWDSLSGRARIYRVEKRSDIHR